MITQDTGSRGPVGLSHVTPPRVRIRPDRDRSRPQTSGMAVSNPPCRLACCDWQAVEADLDREGVAVLTGLLAPHECAALAALYDSGGEGSFRSRVVMARHGFGRGEYKYFDYPLPELLSQLRTALYARLVPTANRWNAALGPAPRYPASHAEYLARCHAAGQTRATPLLLRYGPGDFNCLHQDLYGEHVFPLQAVILLSQPGEAFDGGEFVLTEQRP
jgi:hypothetical protein